MSTKVMPDANSNKSTMDDLTVAHQQFFLGEAYYYGKTSARDYARAYNWYRKAAEKGHADAQYALGVMYEHGRGIDQNLEKAFYWYQLAAGKMQEKALNNAGCMLFCGQGCRVDASQAAACFLASAKKGFAPAQFNLSVLFLLGRGIQKDTEKAFAWCRLAAQKGHAQACLRLSYMLEHGIGVDKDGMQARAWHERAQHVARSRIVYDVAVKGTADRCDDLLSQADAGPKDAYCVKKNVEVRGGVLYNDYCSDCLLCCGPQPAADNAFVMNLLDRQIDGKESSRFYMQGRQCAVLDHRGCKALGEHGCRLERHLRPVACNIFPFVLMNMRLYMYKPCPLHVVLEKHALINLAEQVRAWLELQPESEVRHISLHADPGDIGSRYEDMLMPVQCLGA